MQVVMYGRNREAYNFIATASIYEALANILFACSLFLDAFANKICAKPPELSGAPLTMRGIQPGHGGMPPECRGVQPAMGGYPLDFSGIQLIVGGVQPEPCGAPPNAGGVALELFASTYKYYL